MSKYCQAERSYPQGWDAGCNQLVWKNDRCFEHHWENSSALGSSASFATTNGVYPKECKLPQLAIPETCASYEMTRDELKELMGGGKALSKERLKEIKNKVKEVGDCWVMFSSSWLTPS